MLLQESVHFLSIPEFDASKINQSHVDRVNTMQTVVELGRQIRDRATLSIKQPVRDVIVVQNNAEVLAHVDGLQGYIAAVRRGTTLCAASTLLVV